MPYEMNRPYARFELKRMLDGITSWSNS